jgi:hypothetical protein
MAWRALGRDVHRIVSEGTRQEGCGVAETQLNYFLRTVEAQEAV